MMTSRCLRNMSNGYRENALLGTWAKAGKSKYVRVTGEVVEKKEGRWVFDGFVYTSASAAMWNADRKYC